MKKYVQFKSNEPYEFKKKSKYSKINNITEYRKFKMINLYTWKDDILFVENRKQILFTSKNGTCIHVHFGKWYKFNYQNKNENNYDISLIVAMISNSIKKLYKIINLNDIFYDINDFISDFELSNDSVYIKNNETYVDINDNKPLFPLQWNW